jgi:hypothetical protein
MREDLQARVKTNVYRVDPGGRIDMVIRRNRCRIRMASRSRRFQALYGEHRERTRHTGPEVRGGLRVRRRFGNIGTADCSGLHD